MADGQRDTELVLPPGVFAYVLDQTKGYINVLCGPIKQSLSQTDQMVVFDPLKKRFVPAASQQMAIQTNTVAPKGSYVVLENPSNTGNAPEPGKAEIMPLGTLRHGQIENLSGPQSFPLWPGQIATVVPGHQLRWNQYLVVRVYDDEAAKLNWDKSIVQTIKTQSATTDSAEVTDSVNGSADRVLQIDRDSLVTGQLLIIKGTAVAFYIPPTGIEVLSEDRQYVRDAVTLERLEYAILVGEDGNKVYKRGPDVVFPTPTQKFYTKTNSAGVADRKFRAYELQPHTGLHIKVIADYEGFKAGDELFITGADTPIYYPREEHATILYDGQDKSYAVAIPPGEGRYVLDRSNGHIHLITGPRMFLPNPIKEVIVRRILSPTDCDLYYPGNTEASIFNRSLLQKSRENDPTAGAASPYNVENFYTGNNVVMAAATLSASPAATQFASADRVNRNNTYTPPRTLTLDTKYEGAVRISVWSGYAIQIVNSAGNRKSVVGPNTVLLEYDEGLERLALSKGVPKTDTQRLLTPYLRYTSNSISDLVTVKTRDLVDATVRLKYLVRFEEKEIDRWFSIPNYVQYLTDHLRSVIANSVRGLRIVEFNANPTNLLRDIVIGKADESGERPLRHFTENGMTVYDLELVEVEIRDRNIANAMAAAQQETLLDMIQIERADQRTILVTKLQEAQRKQADEVASTTVANLELQRLEIRHGNEVENERQLGFKQVAELKKAIADITLSIETARLEQHHRFEDVMAERTIWLDQSDAEAQKLRIEALAPKLVEALTAIAQTGQLEAIAEHLAPLSIVRGTSLAGTLEALVRGTPIEGIFDNLTRLSNLSIGSETAA